MPSLRLKLKQILTSKTALHAKLPKFNVANSVKLTVATVLKPKARLNKKLLQPNSAIFLIAVIVSRLYRLQTITKSYVPGVMYAS